MILITPACQSGSRHLVDSFKHLHNTHTSNIKTRDVLAEYQTINRKSQNKGNASVLKTTPNSNVNVNTEFI